jgi:AraC-like DNA-binding protein
MLRAQFVGHVYSRHTHEGYVIGVIERGVESFSYRGDVHHAPAGSIVLVDPGEVHDGFAGIPEGWSYRTSYPSIDVVSSVAQELGLAGTVTFPEPVVHDPDTAAAFVAAHRAAETADALATSSLVRAAYARTLRRHARPRSVEAPHLAGGPTAVAVARELLHARVTDPPTLPELAAAVGLSPFALARTFRNELGLPPHAYLNQLRVRRAKALLDNGEPPAAVAQLVGFVDQAHLSRHFKRMYGVPPGAYRRERAAKTYKIEGRARS